jgi:hypothetical protein
VALVQALRERKRGLGAEAELAVGLALQAGQVKEQRAGLRAGLAFFVHAARLAAHRVGNGARLWLRPEAVGAGFGVFAFLPLRVEPLAGVVAGLRGKARVHFPVVAAHEAADFFFALDHERERGRLHAAHGGQKEAAVARVERRHRARAVDAHEPVGLGAAARGLRQALHLRVRAQRGKAVADGLRRHGLQPQAPHGLAQRHGVAVLAAARVLLDQAEDQLALAARVAGVDELGHVLAPRQAHHGAQAALGLVHGLELEIRRNHGQVRKAPFAALDVVGFGRLDLEQVAHGAGDDVALVLEIIVVLVEFARHGREGAHDVLRDGGLFGDDQGFAHAEYFGVFSTMFGLARAYTRAQVQISN